MGKKNKKIHKEIYKRNIGTYKYNSNYKPDNDWLMDTRGDYYDMYGTEYPNYDKIKYDKPMREYKTDNQ